jgi:hypothetical protein
LPSLIRLEDFGGDAQAWLDAVYKAFRRSFVTSRPQIGAMNVGISRRMAHDSREERFWHLATEGADEVERSLDPRRCERMAWPRALIDALAGAHPEVRAWDQERPRQKTLVIGLDDFSYVVVLAVKTTHYLLVTAFCVEHSRRRDTYRREWERASHK